MITQHAMRRWVERVDGVDLGKAMRIAWANGSDGDQSILAVAAELGLVDLADVRRRIAVPLVVAACQLEGECAVKIGGHTLLIGDHHVITVYSKAMRRATRAAGCGVKRKALRGSRRALERKTGSFGAEGY